MPSIGVQVEEYCQQYEVETVKMWRQSFQRAMGLEEYNRFHELTDHLEYFRSLDPSQSKVAVEMSSAKIVGLLTMSDEELINLFVHVDFQRCGIGKLLLLEAKRQSPEGFFLYTFVKNGQAQTFYLTQGFSEVERSYASAEGNPWATSKEQLADIKYQWSANG